MAQPLAAREPSAPQLAALARANRYQQDSTLAEYRALAKQRWTGSVGIAAAGGLGPLGRMRLAARSAACGSRPASRPSPASAGITALARGLN